MRILAAIILASAIPFTVHAQPASSEHLVAAALTTADSKREERNEEHIKTLHTRLKITAAEEPLWEAVAKTMRDNATQLDQAVDKREAAVGSASAVDDLNAYADIAQLHADSVKKMSVAFGPLYAAMPEDQKKLADSVFTQHERGRKKAHKAEK